MDTPTTPEGLTRYDGRPAAESVARAWLAAGPHPEHHARAQDQVCRAMPLLARALDRLAVEQATPPDRPQEPFCGCGHHRALHDTEGGECHQRVNIFKGTGADTIRMQQCTCRQYVGPEPISSVWVPPAQWRRKAGEDDPCGTPECESGSARGRRGATVGLAPPGAKLAGYFSGKENADQRP